MGTVGINVCQSRKATMFSPAMCSNHGLSLHEYGIVAGCVRFS